VVSARPRRLSRSDFRVFRPVTTRWADNDVYGHVNNVVYYSWFDTAVNGWLIESGLLDIRASEVVALVVETSCTYFASAAFPDEISVGLAVARIGTSSVTYRLGIFRGEDDLACAQGQFTHVYVLRDTQAPTAMPATVRAELETLLS
jgi:acyl-CoA thioester hydrolase